MKNKIIPLILLPLISISIFSCSPQQDSEEKGDSFLTLDIYASNDFHGQIDGSGKRMGLARFGTFMKQKGEEENTLLLDQGDSWQGSIYSNYNRGDLINYVMAEAKFDARTVGNHDFDWGLDALIKNSQTSYNGYTTPVLAANVYDYDFVNKKEGTTFQSSIGQKSITYTLENGLKVGIVGVIGKDQITSISSMYVEDVYFKDHIEVIKEEATKLKESGCDIVICTAHTGQESLMNNGLDKYVDLALCAHTHKNERGQEGNLNYAQFGSNGEYIGHIKLTYDTKEKKVSKTEIKSLDSNYIYDSIDKIDDNIASIIKTYKDECQEEADVVVASNTSYFDRYECAANLMCKAIYDECLNEGFDDIDFAMCNEARSNIYGDKWTYASIYSAFPFDNEVCIVSAKGEDIIHELGYINVCISPDFIGVIDPNAYYKIAVVDFILCHTNVKRYYDYFSHFDGQIIDKLDDNYRVILKNWLIDNGYNNKKKLDSSLFLNTNPEFDKESLIAM